MKNNAPVSIDIVVERQLFILHDVAVGKDAHSDIAADGPFRDVTVRVA